MNSFLKVPDFVGNVTLLRKKNRTNDKINGKENSFVFFRDSYLKLMNKYITTIG